MWKSSAAPAVPAMPAIMRIRATAVAAARAGFSIRWKRRNRTTCRARSPPTSRAPKITNSARTVLSESVADEAEAEMASLLAASKSVADFINPLSSLSPNSRACPIR